MSQSIQLNVSKRGLLGYAFLLVICDMLSTYLVAKTDLGVFLQFEVNPLLKWAFAQFGWASFLFYPLVPMLLYWVMVSAGFGTYFYFEKKGQGKIVKGYIYFLIAFVQFHILICISNFTLYYNLVCK